MADNRDKQNAYKELLPAMRERNNGDRLNFTESLDRTVSEMERDLADIEQGEWNGTRIKDPAQIPSYLTTSLDKVLTASAAVMNTVSRAGGWTDFLQVPYEGREELAGTNTVDLLAAGEKLKGAVNDWLGFVARHPEFQQGLEMPLAINHIARTEPNMGIDGLSDVTTLTTKGYQPIEPITNEKAGIAQGQTAEQQVHPTPNLTGMKI